MNQKVGAMEQVIAWPKAAKAKTKTKSKLPEILLGSFLFICLLFLSLFIYEQVYANKIFAHTKVAGIDVAGKNKQEAESLIAEQTKDLSEKQIAVIHQDQSKNVKLADLGVSVDPKTQAKNVYSFGRDKNWLDSKKEIISALFKTKNFPLEINISDEKLNQFLAQYEDKINPPKNAGLKIEGTTVNIVPPVKGDVLDNEKFKTDLDASVSYLTFNSLDITVKQNTAKILEDGVLDAKAQAGEMLKKSVTLTFENKAYKAEGAQVGLFIKFDEKDNKLEATFNDGEIDKYIAGIAAKTDIKPKDKQILSTTGQVIDEGSDGRALDRIKTKAQIKEVLSGSQAQYALKVDEKKRGEKKVVPKNVAVGGRFAGKYIDLDLSEQKLYAFDGETLVRSFLISSGLPATPTPIGTFSIYSRSRASLMAGPGYYLPNVQWVNRFNESRSIHGTYWHHNFGHPMSHGCVNATNGDAEFIYTWAPMGTPVIIHQ